MQAVSKVHVINSGVSLSAGTLMLATTWSILTFHNSWFKVKRIIVKFYNDVMSALVMIIRDV